MTVGELKKALEGIHNDTIVFVRDDCTYATDLYLTIGRAWKQPISHYTPYEFSADEHYSNDPDAIIAVLMNGDSL